MASYRRKRPSQRFIICFRGDAALRNEIRLRAERAQRTQSDYLRLLVKEAIAREGKKRATWKRAA